LKTDTLYCNIHSAAARTRCNDRTTFNVYSEEFIGLTMKAGFQQHETYVRLTMDVWELLRRHVAEKEQDKEKKDKERVEQEG
tara:strand:- start:11810 stop:12055 length:246 start_codon:yes stop_codon:yes gene_type:complete